MPFAPDPFLPSRHPVNSQVNPVRHARTVVALGSTEASSGTATRRNEQPPLPVARHDPPRGGPPTSQPHGQPAGKNNNPPTSVPAEMYLGTHLAQRFNYPPFNAVQRRCARSLLHSSRSVVVSAPTGSGKTRLLELAIIHLFRDRIDPGNTIPPPESNLASATSTGPPGPSDATATLPTIHRAKAVYICPIKALAAQIHATWTNLFEAQFGVSVHLETGDSDIDASLAKVASADVVVTTPERWDSITRRWKDGAVNALVGSVALLLIDEVHFLAEPRGAVLEAIVSRMHNVKAVLVDKPSKFLRFVAVSGTIPNAADIARWLQVDLANDLIICPPSDRPVPLSVRIIGYKSTSRNPFAFDRFLNFKLPGVIRQFSNGKPALVFCMSRRGTQQTASYLASEPEGISFQAVAAAAFLQTNHCRDHSSSSSNVPGSQQTSGVPINRSTPLTEQTAREENFNFIQSLRFDDAGLKQCALGGVGYHNAALSLNDRKHIEALFIQQRIAVLCTTTTLAMGVNLPARLVVLHGTACYKGSCREELPLTDVHQMVGRAGRPGFDTEGIAVILTQTDKAHLYEPIQHGMHATTVESFLHKRMITHLNAEITLKTITSIDQAYDWLRTTFFWIRFQANPQHYCSSSGEAFADSRGTKRTDNSEGGEGGSAEETWEGQACSSGPDSVPDDPKATITAGPSGVSDCNRVVDGVPFVRDLVKRLLRALVKAECAEVDFIGGQVRATPIGRLTARYYITFETTQMAVIHANSLVADAQQATAHGSEEVQGSHGQQPTGTDEAVRNGMTEARLRHGDLRGVIEVIANADEVCTENPLRHGDKTALNKCNKLQRYQISTGMKAGREVRADWQKAFVLIQAALSDVKIEDWSLRNDVARMWTLLPRVSKFLGELYIWKRLMLQAVAAWNMTRAFQKRFWHDDVTRHCKQIPKLGEVLCRTLASANFHSFRQVAEADPRQLEAICGRHPPFGSEIVSFCRKIPSPRIVIEIDDLTPTGNLGKKPAAQGGQTPSDASFLTPTHRLTVTVSFPPSDMTRSSAVATAEEAAVQDAGDHAHDSAKTSPDQQDDASMNPFFTVLVGCVESNALLLYHRFRRCDAMRPVGSTNQSNNAEGSGGGDNSMAMPWGPNCRWPQVSFSKEVPLRQFAERTRAQQQQGLFNANRSIGGRPRSTVVRTIVSEPGGGGRGGDGLQQQDMRPTLVVHAVAINESLMGADVSARLEVAVATGRVPTASSSVNNTFTAPGMDETRTSHNAASNKETPTDDVKTAMTVNGATSANVPSAYSQLHVEEDVGGNSSNDHVSILPGQGTARRQRKRTRVVVDCDNCDVKTGNCNDDATLPNMKCGIGAQSLEGPERPPPRNLFELCNAYTATRGKGTSVQLPSAVLHRGMVTSTPLLPSKTPTDDKEAINVATTLPADRYTAAANGSAATSTVHPRPRLSPKHIPDAMEQVYGRKTVAAAVCSSTIHSVSGTAAGEPVDVAADNFTPGHVTAPPPQQQQQQQQQQQLRPLHQPIELTEIGPEIHYSPSTVSPNNATGTKIATAPAPTTTTTTLASSGQLSASDDPRMRFRGSLPPLASATSVHSAAVHPMDGSILEHDLVSSANNNNIRAPVASNTLQQHPAATNNVRHQDAPSPSLQLVRELTANVAARVRKDVARNRQPTTASGYPAPCDLPSGTVPSYSSEVNYSHRADQWPLDTSCGGAYDVAGLMNQNQPLAPHTLHPHDQQHFYDMSVLQQHQHQPAPPMTSTGTTATAASYHQGYHPQQQQQQHPDWGAQHRGHQSAYASAPFMQQHHAEPAQQYPGPSWAAPYPTSQPWVPAFNRTAAYRQHQVMSQLDGGDPATLYGSRGASGSGPPLWTVPPTTDFHTTAAPTMHHRQQFAGNAHPPSATSATFPNVNQAPIGATATVNYHSADGGGSSTPVVAPRGQPQRRRVASFPAQSRQALSTAGLSAAARAAVVAGQQSAQFSSSTSSLPASVVTNRWNR